MTRHTDDEPPCLGCPDCDRALFPATGRGFTGDDGEYIEHASTCRCHLCGWVWQEGEDATCECGAYCVVNVDDGIACVSEVIP